MSVTYLIGDTRDRIAEIPDGSVALVATSPPFVALRSYLPADHPMKHAEIGSEPDPATFIDTLLALTAEWGRVLAPWGSIAVELGDTYAGSGGGGGDYNPGGLREGQQVFSGSAKAERRSAHAIDCDMGEDCSCGYEEFAEQMRASNAAHWRQKNAVKDAWPRPKCLALVPQAYALSLAYGRNVLTGEPSPAGQWLVRNMIVWHRPNPAVGALGDKFRPSTSYICVATQSPKRWFDLTAVRQPYKVPDHPQVGKPTSYRPGMAGEGYGDVGQGVGRIRTQDPAGAPPLDAWFDEHDTWTMTTQPSSLAHYAMWPAKLAERLVLSMCPQWVCATCGEPRRRVEQRTNALGLDSSKVGGGSAKVVQMAGGIPRAPDHDPGRVTLGWTDCGHDNYRPGTVLDPFAGTGTTLAVADCHGRDAIGIDIDERNRALYDARRAEVRKTLFGVEPENPNQLDLFGGDAA
jgi:hypothetical protein